MIAQQSDELEKARKNLGNPFELFAKLVNNYDKFIKPGISGEKSFGEAKLEARKWLLSQEYLERMFFEHPWLVAIPPKVLVKSRDIANDLVELVESNRAEEFSFADYLSRNVTEFDFILSGNPDYEKYRVRKVA